jgi:hypothetical protein
MAGQGHRHDTGHDGNPQANAEQRKPGMPGQRGPQPAAAAGLVTAHASPKPPVAGWPGSSPGARRVHVSPVRPRLAG